MKSVSLVRILGALVMIAAASQAFADGNDGTKGGGNTLRTTELDVEFQAFGAASNLARMLKSPFIDAKADVMRKKIVSVLNTDNFGDGKSYYFENAPCKDQDSQGHMGGAVIGDTSKPFCLSKSLLTVMPDEITLFKQLIALMAHEMAHQAGYDEKDAVYFQRTTYAQYAFDWLRATSYYRFENTSHYISDALKELSTSGSYVQLCFALGTLERAINVDRGMDFGGIDPQQSPIVKRLGDHYIALLNIGSSGKLVFPCLKPESMDKEALSKLLEDARKHADSIVKLLGPAPGGSIK